MGKCCKCRCQREVFTSPLPLLHQENETRGSQFVGVWQDKPTIYAMDNSSATSQPQTFSSEIGTITITEVLPNSFYKVAISRNGITPLNNVLMYDEGRLVGQLAENNFANFYFENDILIQQFQALDTSSNITYFSRDILTRKTV